jgi:NAD(P)-dependent dehydrogenase (short-subunit alcohol dehydrogenase family)
VIAWITGGGTGIGRAIAEGLYSRGAKVAISGRRSEVLETAIREIRSKFARQDDLLAVPCNVADQEGVRSAAQVIRERLGEVSLLVNNAGVNKPADAESAQPAAYAEMFATNCLGPIMAAREVLPSMRQKNSGTIVNVSSILGRWGSSNSAPYSVSKYALAGFSDVLRQHLRGTGIHVMAVYPGYIRTAMTEPHVKPGSWKSKTGATPESVARAVLRGIDARRDEVSFPWYVSWAVRWHRAMPRWSDNLARGLRERNEKEIS